MSKNVFLCGGQGNAYYLMGKELYDHHPLFRKRMDQVDAVFQESTGNSLISILYNANRKKSDLFHSLMETHPAVFGIEYAMGMTLYDEGIRPDYVVGISLGEFVAAAISGVMTLEQSLPLVIHQADCVSSHTPRGAMIAIIENQDFFHRMEFLKEYSTLAGVLCPDLFAVSCLAGQCARITEILDNKKVVFQVLPVDYAFHSPHIDAAEQPFLANAKQESFKKPDIPYISSFTRGHVSSFSADHFWKAVREPMQFMETIAAFENGPGYVFYDLTPSGTLDGFVKKIGPKSTRFKSFKIMTQFTGKSLENLKNVIKSNRMYSEKIKLNRGNTMHTYLFPGQGSQRKGFGGELFDEFADYTKKADNVLGYSIKDLCLNDPDGLLNQTEYTQPAIYVVNALFYLKKLKEDGIKPDYVAGHSLGEYNALLAAGVFDFETGLKIVKARGRFMAESADSGDGLGMAAVIGFDEEKVSEILKNHGFSGIDVANYNSPYQIVISGYIKDIDAAKKVFEDAGVKMFVPLKVSSAFHSRYMEKAKRDFENFIKDFEFFPQKIKVISNVTARPHKDSTIKQMLCEQIVRSVRWTDSIRYLMGKGDMDFKEVGAGNVLTGLLNRILKEATPLVVEDEEEEAGEEINEEKAREIPEEKTGESPATMQFETTGKTGAGITPESLGSDEFKKDYGVKYAYAAGAMYKLVASKELVVRMGKAGFLSFLGTGGVPVLDIENSIRYIQEHLNNNEPYGVNLLCNINNPDSEDELVDLYMKYGITNVEAAAYMSITPSLTRYRLKGLGKTKNGVEIRHRIIAKISRPEVAHVFLSPAPERIVQKLIDKGAVTKEEAELAKSVPMADDLCVEADSGGHTDMGVAYVLMPAILVLRDEMMKQYQYAKKVRVGAAGGIGTPEAAAAAIIMGAEFLVTGSINQCTVEAGTSDIVKDLLEGINVQDTEYAPAGDMFELGARVQVLRKGLFFPARANKLYNLYLQYNSLDELDEKTKKQLEEKYFRKSFDEIWKETKEFFRKTDPKELERAEKNPKQKMSLVFRWYFGYSTRLALEGVQERKVDFQIHCGPALGAFNQWVKGSPLASWRNRHPDEIAEKLIKETADLLNRRFALLMGK
ncbi:MAG: ACP S-malonyltransferase [Spirochaetales bacterium]|nr:ACP S-malonyltransferase [Spirochaetales bacterium]